MLRQSLPSVLLPMMRTANGRDLIFRQYLLGLGGIVGSMSNQRLPLTRKGQSFVLTTPRVQRSAVSIKGFGEEEKKAFWDSESIHLRDGGQVDQRTVTRSRRRRVSSNSALYR